MTGENDGQRLLDTKRTMSGPILSSSSKNLDFENKSNVFKRLSTSPSNTYASDLSKPPARISPVRRSPARQLTPKRLASPTCLKEYIPKEQQEPSLPPVRDRAMENAQTTSLIFTTSPTKAIFSNEKRIGGDGSLSKLRSRFSNGLISPQRLSSIPSNSMEMKGRNLFNKLQDLEHSSTDDDVVLITKSNSPGETIMSQDGKIVKNQQPKKKVKFDIPSTQEVNSIDPELTDVKSLLQQIISQQKVLETRLIDLEEKVKGKKDK